MRWATLVGGTLAIVVATQGLRGADTNAVGELARLKKDQERAWKVLDTERQAATNDAGKRAAVDRYYERNRALARRALALAEAHPEASEAPEALVWLIGLGWQGAPALEKTTRVAAYDLMVRRYLDREALLPVIRLAWHDGVLEPHVEVFLDAAAERSPNPKVRALAEFSRGRLQLQLLELAHKVEIPARGEGLRTWLGPEGVQRIRAFDKDLLRSKAEASYERTIRQYGKMQPMGKDFPPLGEQAKGDLFKIRHLEPGCPVPDIEGEDIDGMPMKLSDFRGKVVAISFWATWCGPCMGMVPQEKALVKRMKGRPFALVGVNGDTDRSQARKVSAEKGISWRSFWDGGRPDGIAVGWGINGWPTVYLIDAKGVIRDWGLDLRGATLDKGVEDLVAEAEKGASKP